MMHRCIAIHNVSICVSILQVKYRYINILMHCCVLINKNSVKSVKIFKIIFFVEKDLRKILSLL